MIVHDKNHEKHYTRLHNRIAEDPNLSIEAKGIQWYLLTKPPYWKIYKKQLKEALKVSRWTFDRAWSELVQWRYIVRENHEWYAYETPQDAGGQHQESCKSDPKNVADQHQKMSAASNINVGSQHLVTTSVITNSNNVKKKQEDQVASLPPPVSSQNDVLVDLVPHLPSNSTNPKPDQKSHPLPDRCNESSSNPTNPVPPAESGEQRQLRLERMRREGEEAWAKMPEKYRNGPFNKEAALYFLNMED